MYDDIPEARRQAVPKTASSPSRGNPALWIGSGIGLLAIAIGAAFAVGLFKPEPSQSKVETSPTASPLQQGEQRPLIPQIRP